MRLVILLVATVCLKLDAVTLRCRTEVVRVEPTMADCARMIEPTTEWLREAFKPEWLGVACKAGTMG
jgi:hypothetical protein